MVSAQFLDLIDDVKSKSFKPQWKKGCTGDKPSFGGKRVLLVGDLLQLPCVKGVTFNSNKNLSKNNVPDVKGRLEAKGKQI